MPLFIAHLDINECIPDQCQNGATCVDLIANFQCECPEGYEGKTCDIGIPFSIKMKKLYISLQ